MRFSFKFQKHHFVLLAIVLVFIALRVPALGMPYYQDENEWPEIVAEGSVRAGAIPHPPLSEGLYVVTDRLFGNENLRMAPFLLSIVNVMLVYVLVRRRFGVREALWATGLLAVGYYSILASIVVDTDGQVLPFFFLIAALAYYGWQETTSVRKKWLWGGVFLGAMIIGFLTKLGFVVAAGAFVLDFLYQRRAGLTAKRLALYGTWLGAFAVTIALLIVASQWLFPDFNLAQSIKYWQKFMVLERNFFQTGVQVAKSLMFISPLLLALPFLLSKELRHKSSLFFFFLLAGVVFYVLLFDFSGAALDRYFQFTVIPLSILGGVALASIHFDSLGRRTQVVGTILGLSLIGLQFLSHAVPALHPKTEWLSRLATFEWNFLFPFTGGSGPMGFYVSFLIIALAFICCAIVVAGHASKKLHKTVVASILLIVGFTYNALFLEEYYLGAVNGNSRALLENALEYIGENSEIKKVITYNDMGYYELVAMGKYQRRLYADPAFVESYIPILREFDGHYLVVEVPRIDPGSIYVPFFKSCIKNYARSSGEITASIYDCRAAKAP